MMKLKSLVLTSHKWFENRSGLCVSRCCQLEPTLKRLNSTLERRRKWTSAAVSEWRDYFSEAWSSPPTRASYYQQSNVKVRTWCETCLAPRARLTSHPVRWNAVDRHQSFQQDWCTFVLIIEGWGSLFLPEWIHVWLENATFFRNCFIRDPRRLQRATWQSSALLDCVLSGNEDSLTQSEEKRDLEGVFRPVRWILLTSPLWLATLGFSHADFSRVSIFSSRSEFKNPPLNNFFFKKQACCKDFTHKQDT